MLLRGVSVGPPFLCLISYLCYMTTGADLSKLFDDKIDNSYSDYVSVAKKQRAFDNAFLRIIENKYRGMDTQKEFDELSELIVIDKEFEINNNRFKTDRDWETVIYLIVK